VHRNVGWKARREETAHSVKYRWEDIVKMNHREIGLEGVDWIHLA
jgi:hypothetical protein